MGCCPSKCPGATPRKEYAATTTDVAPTLPSSGSANHVQITSDNAVHDMLMDRGDGTRMDKSDDKEPAAEEDDEPDEPTPEKATEAANALNVIQVRVPEHAAVVSAVHSPPSPPPSPPRKSSRSADDIPISSTYHRVHSAVVAEQEVKRQEELRLEAEQREREVQEYKASMQQPG